MPASDEQKRESLPAATLAGALVVSSNVSAIVAAAGIPVRRLVHTVAGHTSAVYSVFLSADGTRLVTGSGDKTARLWDVRTGRCLMTYEGHSSGVYSVFLSADGTCLVTGSGDKTARLWDVRTGRCLMTYEGHSNIVTSVFLSADGTRLVTGSYDDTARLWDVRTGRCLMTYEGHSDCVKSASLSADGTRLVTGSIDNMASDCTRLVTESNTAKLWDVRTGRCLMTYKGHSGGVDSVFLSADGTRLVTGSDDHTARLWDVRTGHCLKTYGGHPGGVKSVFLSADGTRLVTVSGDKTARLWDVRTGRCLMTYSGGAGSVFLSADGTRLVTESAGYTAKFWDVASGQLLATLHHVQEGFLWTTPPDDDARCGWLHTDRDELVHVIECDEDGSNPRALDENITEDRDRRKAYLAGVKREGMVMNRLHDSRAYQKGLKDMRMAEARHRLLSAGDGCLLRLNAPKPERGETGDRQ
jgi:WD40 repeat protein